MAVLLTLNGTHANIRHADSSCLLVQMGCFFLHFCCTYKIPLYRNKDFKATQVYCCIQFRKNMSITEQ